MNLKFLLASCLALLCLGAFAQDNRALMEIRERPAIPYYRSAETQIPLTIYDDRVGIQVHSGIARSAVEKIAAAERLTIERTFYRGIYELALPGAAKHSQIDALARRLQADYKETVKVAGLVVQSRTSSTPWVMTRRLLLVFDAKPSVVEQKSLSQSYPLESLEPLEGCETIFVSTVSSDFHWDVAALAELIANDATAGVDTAHANYIAPITSHGTAGLGDPRLDEQWHHDNLGLDDAIADADIDSKEAWKITTGNNTHPLIAIIDSAFKIDHVDLLNNLWIDADGTTRGRDFDDNEHSSLLNSTTSPNYHGTAVAGIAGAIADNGHVGRGICPDCRMLLLRHAGDIESATRAMCFAIGQNAKVISNSWGPEGVFDALNQAISEATNIHKIPVLFAMESGDYRDRCDESPPTDVPSLPNVIGVSSVTDQDARTPSGFGNCMDLLAPSRRGATNGIVTTKVFYDAASSTLYDGIHLKFGGTSAATPMVAGTIGLMQDVNNSLTHVQIQRVLQDTADKVDPDKGFYDAESGFSMPPESTSTHGYGRINALEAVSLVAPFNPGETDLGKRGHGGKDLLLRDHELDWGNTERPSNELFTPSDPRQTTSVHRSVDIKLDVFPFDDSLEETAESFSGMASEDPEIGKRADVYVRLRNRGPVTVDTAYVRLYWTLANPLPDLPPDFWTQLTGSVQNPPDPATWNALPAIKITDVEYSGASAAGCPDRDVPDCLPLDNKPSDGARIAKFPLPALDWDESSGAGLSLLAIAHSDNEDPVLAKLAGSAPIDLHDVSVVVAWDNNVAMWSSLEDEPCCQDWLRALVIIAIVATLLLVAYIIIQWLKSDPVPPKIYIVLILLLLLLLIIWLVSPCCLEFSA